MAITMTSQSSGTTEICTPVRNRYFYGKLLDVFHFELEQNYFNNKRWLLNRVVTGYGVVCGLNVSLGSDGQSVVVSPGVAIDKCGREIILCQQSESCPLPPPTAPPAAPAPTAAPGQPTGGSTTGTGTGTQPTQPTPPAPPAATTMNGDCSETSGNYCHLCICYHECLTDPSPTLGGDCDCQPACTPGAVRERYCLKIVDGKLCPPSMTSPFYNATSTSNLTYGMLANYVTNQNCLAQVEDCCIPLANIQIPVLAQTPPQPPYIVDITIRPIVYTNDLLYDMILSYMNQGSSSVRGTK
jgi:hypothetical protein